MESLLGNIDEKAFLLHIEALTGSEETYIQFQSNIMEGNSGTLPFRSLRWKVFLFLPRTDRDTWKEVATEHRKKYHQLCTKYLTNPRSHDKDDLNINNPLSQSEDSPWKEFFDNTQLRVEIEQDVTRTCQTEDFFRNEQNKALLNRILFIYANEHSDLKYVQGMNEVLAPIFYVLHTECNALKFETEFSFLMDASYIEHDTYVLFEYLMEVVKHWFIEPPRSPLRPACENSAILRKCNDTIQLVKHFDPELYVKIRDTNIEPELFLLKWIRILLTQVFPLQDLLQIWDAIFAQGNNCELLFYICVAMLSSIRHILLELDYSQILVHIFNYPHRLISIPRLIQQASQYIPLARRIPIPSTEWNEIADFTKKYELNNLSSKTIETRRQRDNRSPLLQALGASPLGSFFDFSKMKEAIDHKFSKHHHEPETLETFENKENLLKKVQHVIQNLSSIKPPNTFNETKFTNALEALYDIKDYLLQHQKQSEKEKEMKEL